MRAVYAVRLTATLALLSCLAPVRTLAAAPAPLSQKAAAKQDAEAEAALDKAFADSGNDRAVLVRALQQYLLEFPNAPRKPDVYRALVDACQHLGNDSCALNYAERLIAIEPADSDMMLLAVTYLERKGDDESLAQASGYVTRVLDRVEKALPEERPSGQSLAAWQARQQNLLGVLYYLRGEIRYSRQDYGLAATDLETSYAIRPSASTAEMLGEIAEMNANPQRAIDEYTLAFVLPDPGPEARVDRLEIRERLDNVWRDVHGSDQGLGDEILAAYDRVASLPDAPTSDGLNKNASDALAFTLRRMDGTPMALSTMRGKVTVINFWATWCVPCAPINAEFDQLAMAWSGEPRVVFLMADTQDEEANVPSFVQKQKWHVAAVYADGLDRFLKIRTLPAAVVIGPGGHIVYRVEYPAARGFASPVSAAIQQALAAAH
jgi:thiol-disulfide isomerase/thioredoxin